MIKKKVVQEKEKKPPVHKEKPKEQTSQEESGYVRGEHGDFVQRIGG